MLETKKEVEQTTNSENVSSEENKDEKTQEEETSQKNESSEENSDDTYTPPTKEEWEKIRKKAIDFDGIIEKQKIERLKKKEEKKDEEEEKDIQKIIDQKVQEAVSKVIPKNNDVDEALGVWVKTNNWIDDNKLDVIRETLSLSGNETKEAVIAKLNIAAQNAFPIEFWEENKKKIAAKANAEAHNLNVGESGSTGSTNTGEHKSNVLTKKQIELARACGNDPEIVYKD